MSLRWPSFLSLPQPARIDVRGDALVLSVESGSTHRVDLPGPASEGSIDWSGALHELCSRAGAVLRPDVVVHPSHARLFVVQAIEALDTEERWRAYAVDRLSQWQGDEAGRQWHVRVVAERPGRPRLVAALPGALMEAVRERFGSRLRSVWIEPLLRLDELKRQDHHFSGAWVDLGVDHALIALFDDGVLQRMRLRRAPPQALDLASTVRAEWAALERSPTLPALALGPAPEAAAAAAKALSALAPRIVHLH